jgi:YHS domain-containing protein
MRGKASTSPPPVPGGAAFHTAHETLSDKEIPVRMSIILIPLLVALTARAGEKKVDPVRLPTVVDLKNKTCPIGGEAVDGETFIEWNGVRVHFCCPGCDKKFRKNPAKALAKLGFKVVKGKKGKKVVDLGNAKCPGMGGNTKDKVFGDFEGVRIHYCCPMCDRGVRSNLGAALRKLGYGYTPSIVDLRNKTCPSTGKPVDGESHIDHEGIRVHFCCPGCDKMFLKDPAAGFAKLGVDPEKVKAKTK